MTQGGQGGKSAAQKRQEKAQGYGCLALIVVFVAGGILWGMYDEGVFDKKPAKDAPVFGPKQVGRLVEQLSTAADAQGICYGWVIDSGRSHEIKQVTPSYSGTFRPHPPKQAPGRPAATPAPTPEGRSPRSAEIDYDLRELDDLGVEYGSNLGPGQDPRQAPDRCANWVVLQADYSYSESYDEYSFGHFEIKSNLRDTLPEVRYERRLGQVGDDDIDGESGTARLRDAIGALPMLVADEGLAAPVPAETARAAAPPSNDRLHEASVTTRGVWTVIGFAVVGLAAVWIVVSGVRHLIRSRS
ncbi:hypothetical protein ACN3XK_13620 [Actinomadura welshii]